MEKKRMFFKEKPIIYILLSIMSICLIGGIIEGFLWGDLSSLPYSSAFNVVVDLFGMIIGLIVYVSAYHDRTKVHNEIVLFLLLVFFDTINMFIDATCWMLIGHSNLYILNYVSTSIYYIIGFALTALFWHYIRVTILNNDNRIIAIISKVLDIIMGVSMALILINAYSGTLFYVSSDGIYHRGQLYVLTLFAPLIAFFVFTFLIVRSRIPLKQKFSLMSFVIVPVICIIIQSTSFGISIIYPAAMCAILSIYCNYHVTRSIELNTTRDEVTKQKVTYLMNQVHPKFISNEINTILSIIDSDYDKAKDALIDISTYLSENVEALEKEPIIPFEEELKLVKLYANIEKIKYPSIDIVFDTPEVDFNIPRYSVVPLVENAIKHGLIPKAAPGVIKVSTQRVPNGYKISVQDDGVGFSAGWNFRPNKHTPSLQNLEYRLKVLSEGQLSVTSKISVGTQASIVIPETKKIQ